jgi:hypothetical protein
MASERTESSDARRLRLPAEKIWHGTGERARILPGVAAIAHRTGWGAVLVGSLGFGFVFAAFGVLVWQLFHAMEHRAWVVLTTRHVLDDGLVRRVTPAGIRAWLDRPPASGGPVHAAVTWFLNEVPLALVLAGIAVVLLLSARRSERTGAAR